MIGNHTLGGHHIQSLIDCTQITNNAVSILVLPSLVIFESRKSYVSIGVKVPSECDLPSLLIAVVARDTHKVVIPAVGVIAHLRSLREHYETNGIGHTRVGKIAVCIISRLQIVVHQVSLVGKEYELTVQECVLVVIPLSTFGILQTILGEHVSCPRPSTVLGSSTL